jgi:hypothetical protein
MPEESQVESCEHQDNANIHCQPFPELVSEEHEIYTDYDGCHRHHVKHYSYLSAHVSRHFPDDRLSWRPLSFQTNRNKSLTGNLADRSRACPLSG